MLMREEIVSYFLKNTAAFFFSLQQLCVGVCGWASVCVWEREKQGQTEQSQAFKGGNQASMILKWLVQGEELVSAEW